MDRVYQFMKEAWASPDRETRLNRLAEELAAEGTLLAEFDAAIVQLLQDIRAAGADEDTEEILLGVGDRLHGWCHPSCHIRIRESASANGHADSTPAVATLR